MTKVNCPVSLHGVTQRAYDEAGGLDEVLTILPGRKRGQLYDTIDPDRDPAKAFRLPYADVRALSRAGVHAFAEDLARLLGMQLVPLGDAGVAVPVELMARTSALMSETGHVAQTVAAAIADGRLEKSEIRDIRQRALDAQAAAGRLLMDMDQLEAGG